MQRFHQWANRETIARLHQLDCVVLSHSIVSYSLRPHGLQPAKLLCPWGFSRQVYWSGLSCPHPGDLPNPGMEPRYQQCRQILYHLNQQESLDYTRQTLKEVFTEIVITKKTNKQTKRTLQSILRLHRMGKYIDLYSGSGIYMQ